MRRYISADPDVPHQRKPGRDCRFAYRHTMRHKWARFNAVKRAIVTHQILRMAANLKEYNNAE